MIKLGRVKFRIKDFKCEFMGQTVEELNMQELREAKPVITLGEEDGHDQVSEVVSSPLKTSSGGQAAACRFCWGSESTEENPCIVPCKCSGSVGFIHFECLKSWLSTKLQRKESENLVSLYWKTFECEICRQAYPYLFKT